jgi:hypothetical protein
MTDLSRRSFLVAAAATAVISGVDVALGTGPYRLTAEDVLTRYSEIREVAKDLVLTDEEQGEIAIALIEHANQAKFTLPELENVTLFAEDHWTWENRMTGTYIRVYSAIMLRRDIPQIKLWHSSSNVSAVLKVAEQAGAWEKSGRMPWKEFQDMVPSALKERPLRSLVA